MPDKDKPNTNEHKESKSFDKLAAIMQATLQAKPGDRKGNLNVILDSLPEQMKADAGNNDPKSD